LAELKKAVPDCWPNCLKLYKKLVAKSRQEVITLTRLEDYICRAFVYSSKLVSPLPTITPFKLPELKVVETIGIPSPHAVASSRFMVVCHQKYISIVGKHGKPIRTLKWESKPVHISVDEREQIWVITATEIACCTFTGKRIHTMAIENPTHISCIDDRLMVIHDGTISIVTPPSDIQSVMIPTLVGKPVCGHGYKSNFYFLTDSSQFMECSLAGDIRQIVSILPPATYFNVTPDGFGLFTHSDSISFRSLSKPNVCVYTYKHKGVQVGFWNDHQLYSISSVRDLIQIVE
jgi:hypothetical protein